MVIIFPIQQKQISIFWQSKETENYEKTLVASVITFQKFLHNLVQEAVDFSPRVSRILNCLHLHAKIIYKTVVNKATLVNA